MNTILHTFGYKKENFSVTEAFTSAKSAPGIIAVAGFGVLLFFLFGILYCYGAAKLSYDYNRSIGNGSSALLWAVICYFFAAIYYPYYAIMLNPLASAQSNMSGGKRK